MTTRLTLTAVFEVVEDGWVQGRIEEFPGVITAAPNLAEAKDLLVDALGEFLLTQGSPGTFSKPGVAAIREQISVVIGAA